jgi:hypothetical protein
MNKEKEKQILFDYKQQKKIYKILNFLKIKALNKICLI